MPALCIIPLRAVQDASLSLSDLRVLLAIGSHTDRAGGNAWPSAKTLSGEARVGRSALFAALGKLEQSGYIRRTPRYTPEGRQTSSMYEVLLNEGGRVHELVDGEGPRMAGRGRVHACVDTNDPNRNDPKERMSQSAATALRGFTDQIMAAYPPRPEPYPYPAVIREVKRLLAEGKSGADMIQAAREYARRVEKDGTEPKYVKGLVGFLRDGGWESYVITTVHGRTREEWARSGQDVAEFDALAQQEKSHE